MNRRSILTLSAAMLCLGAVHAGAQNPPKLVTEEFMVSQQDGIQLYVRNKASGQHERVHTGTDSAIRSRGNIPLGNFVRSAGRRRIMDGSDRKSWI
jgi:hypothetical protein